MSRGSSALADIFTAVRLVLDGTGFEAQATALADKSGKNVGDRLSQQLSSKLKSAAAAGIGALAGAGMASAISGATQLNELAGEYQVQTGANAQEAKAFSGVLNDLFKVSHQSYDEIAATLIGLKTHFDLSGDAAKTLAANILDFAEIAGGTGADAVERLNSMVKTGVIAQADMAATMDKLTVAHQTWGININETLDSLVKFAPAMNAFGMTTDQAIAWMSIFNKAGVDSQRVVMGFNTALQKVKTPAEFNALVAKIAATPDDLERAKLAVGLFGARAGGALANMLRPGTQSVADMAAVIGTDYVGAVDKAAAVNDNTFGGRALLMLHQFQGALADVGTNMGDLLIVFAMLGPGLTRGLLMGLGGLGGLLLKPIVGAILSAVLPAAAAGETVGLATGTAMGKATAGALAKAAALALPAAVAALIVVLGTEIAVAIDKANPGLAKKIHDDFFAGVEVAGEGIGKIGDFFAPATEKVGQLWDGIVAVHDAISNLGAPAASVDVTRFGDASLAAASKVAAVARQATATGDASLAAAYKYDTAAADISAAATNAAAAARVASQDMADGSDWISAAATKASAIVYTAMTGIGKSYQDAASAMVSAANVAIGAAYDPLINAAELTAAKLKLSDDVTAASATTLTSKQKRALEVRILDEEAHLAALKKAHASYNSIAAAQEAIAADKKKLSAKGVTAAEKAQLDLQLINDRMHIAQLEAAQLQWGTKAEQIAKISGYLTGKAHADGLNSSNLAEQEAANTLDTTLRAVLLKLQGDVYTYGFGTGSSYTGGVAAGIVNGKRVIVAAVNQLHGVVYAKSPPGPESPLHEIDKWGAGTGQAWVDSFAGAIAGGKAGIMGALGGLAMPGVAGGSFGMPYAASRPDFSAQSTRAGAAVLSTRGGDTVGGPTYNIAITNPEPRAAGPDIGRVLRRTAALGMA